MKQGFVFSVLSCLAFGGIALAQDTTVSESTTVTTTTTTVSSGYDFFAPLNINDATPFETGAVDFRLRFEWINGLDDREIYSDPDDDYIVGGSIVWGAAENFQLSFDVPVTVGDAGDRDGKADGNADTYIGAQWRFIEEQDMIPAIALEGTARIPTGDGSSGVDGRFGLDFTKEFGDSDVRGHFNAFCITANGNNTPNERNFQWGFVVGADGPLCADGAVRWIADYMHRSSVHFGVANQNVLELGTEWVISDAHKMGFTTQIGLDGNDDTQAFGARLNYAYTMRY